MKVHAAVAGVVLVGLIASSCGKGEPSADYLAVCEGPPLRNVAEREQAMVDGAEIIPGHECISKRSYPRVVENRARRRVREVMQAPVSPELRKESDAMMKSLQDLEATVAKAKRERDAAVVEAPTLAEARKGFITRFSDPAPGRPPLPNPPSSLFVRADYDGPKGRMPAFVTPDPKDGEKHPAIVWLTGGDTNTLDDFWSARPEANDQAARPFRDAGVVMMFPTLRGGNANPGRKEHMLGEVEDVLAAAAVLAALPYVDPARIYLGGHSTGGTLALLVSESSDRFAAVFSLGPVASVTDYPYDMFRHPLTRGEPEHRLRSPVYWLAGITSPTYVIEGTSPPSNIDSLEEICRETKNPQVACIRVAGSNHLSVISRVAKVIAARIAVPKPGEKWIVRPEEFRQHAGDIGVRAFPDFHGRTLARVHAGRLARHPPDRSPVGEIDLPLASIDRTAGEEGAACVEAKPGEPEVARGPGHELDLELHRARRFGVHAPQRGHDVAGDDHGAAGLEQQVGRGRDRRRRVDPSGEGEALLLHAGLAKVEGVGAQYPVAIAKCVSARNDIARIGETGRREKEQG